MQIATRFSIAVHILALLGAELEQEPTSEFLAGSVGVNPVVIRQVSGLLRKAGLVASSQGKAGTRLARPLDAVSLLDVYRAVDGDHDLFAIHHPNPQCPVGRGIQGTLDTVFEEAQKALEGRLAQTTVAQIIDQLNITL